MPFTFKYLMLLSLLCLTLQPASSLAADAAVERGKYLVRIGGCGDCHTPGYFLGKADLSRYLGGSDVGFRIPPGTFVGPNLTSDKETGLGNWSIDQIVTAITKGTRPDGRMLSEVMPWKDFANLTDADAKAIAAYLKSLPPVSHKVRGPLGPDERPDFPVLTVVVP